MRHIAHPPITLACLLAVAGAAHAQADSSTRPDSTMRFSDTRRVVREAGNHVEETQGDLVSDPSAVQIRFECHDVVVVVPYDRVTVLHYEKSDEPSRIGWPLKRTKHLLAIHYVDTSGAAAAETFHLSDRFASLVLDTLEAHTRRAIDRTPARASFLGIPLRAAVGDRVTIETHDGQQSEGIVTGIAAAALTLDDAAAGAMRFDAATVTRITLTRPRGRDVRRGFGFGALIGGLAGGVFGGLLGRDAASAFRGAAWLGAFTGGAGAITAGLVPSYEFRAARNVYVTR